VEYKWRVVAAIAFMLVAKLANVGVPLLLKDLIDAMDVKSGTPAALLVVPVGLLLAYGGLRLCTSVFNELRELVFARATHGAARSIALATFVHLHNLSLRFHLERQTGGMTRDIERGVRGIESLVSFALFNIIATFVEVLLVLGVLGAKFDWRFVAVTLAALVLYIGFTVWVTEWRIEFRREANRSDSAANTKAIDSLLNTKPSSISTTKPSRHAATTKAWSVSALRSSRAVRRWACSTAVSSSSSRWRSWPCSGWPRGAWSTGGSRWAIW